LEGLFLGSGRVKRQKDSPLNPAADGMGGFLRSAWQQGWLFSLLLVGATFLAYQPIWHAGFIWDDDAFLVDNPLIKQAGGLFRFWFTTAAPDYFPLTSTTLWLEWRLWGNQPLGYHLVNVLLHALSAVLLWRVLARLKIPGARLAAVVFALHPVNVESVAWITERKNTLAMFFYALTLLWHLKSEDTGQRRWYGLAVGAFVLALLSKTAVAPLPLVLLGLAWWRRGRVERADVVRSLPFFGVAVLLGLITIWFQYHRAIGTEVVRADSFGSRVAGAGWAVWFYLGKALLPLDLMFVYPRWRVDGTNVLSYVPGLLVLGGLAVCWRYRRRWGRGPLFSLGYFVVLLLPVLGFLNIYFMRYSLVADHWQYFSILGPITLAGGGITTALGKWRSEKPLLGLVLCGALVLVLGGLTWRQSGMYRDKETLWRKTIDRNPNCALAYNNFGTLLFSNGQADEAIPYFQKALGIQPDYAMARLNLGDALLHKGQVSEAIACFQKVLEIQPPEAAPRAMAYNNLGWIFLQRGQVDEAVAHFQQAVESLPNDARSHSNLGWSLLQKEQMGEAIAHLQKALELQPDFAEAHNSLGIALIQKGQTDEAMLHFQKALAVQPGYAQAHGNLGWLLLRTGRLDEAIAHLQAALKIQPDNATIRSNLASALLKKGQTQ